MATFVEIYKINKSENQTVENNSQTIVPDIALTAVTEESFTLFGVVTSLSSGTDIGGANVVLYNLDGEAIAQTTSSSTGTTIGAFTLPFNGVKDVYYTVTVSAAGYEPFTTAIIYTDKTTASIVVPLSDANTVLSIYGRVVDSTTGAGIANANVLISSSAVLVNVTTGPNGYFLAYDDFVTGTTYSLTATKLGYTGATQTTTITADTIGSEVNFTLKNTDVNYTSITGRIVVAGSDPAVGIENALVGLYAVDTSLGATDLIDTTFTGYLGIYTFNGLDAARTYVVRAIKIDEVTTTTV